MQLENKNISHKLTNIKFVDVGKYEGGYCFIEAYPKGIFCNIIYVDDNEIIRKVENKKLINLLIN